MTVIYVDADACPVKDEIINIAIRHGCRAVMVCNGGIRPHPHPLVDLAIVDDGPDAADIWIAQKADHDDIVVTKDIPLAARAVDRWQLQPRQGRSSRSATDTGRAGRRPDLLCR